MNDDNNKKENNTEENNKESKKPKNEDSSQSNQKNNGVSKKEEKEILEEEKFKELSKEELIEKIHNLEENLNEKKDEIKELKNLNNNWEDKFARLQAEFENTQKRWEKSRRNLRNQYTANTLKNFLSLYDSFKSAVKNEEKNGHIEQFYKQFLNIMKSMGAHPMNTKELEVFDYNKHEALSTIERQDIPSNTIIDVVQEGWMYEKEVLRYAKVIISRKPKPPEPKEEKLEDKEEAEQKEKSDKSKINQEQEEKNQE